jgi:hypothetical protein
MVSRIEPATAPVDGVRLVNGTALPASVVSAARGDACDVALATAVMPTATAVAHRTATSVLSLDMALLAMPG